MPMTKKGLLPNAYRFIHIAADGFEDRILKGRLYHDSREGGMPFIGLSAVSYTHLTLPTKLEV